MDFRNVLKSRIILYLFFFASLIQLFLFSMSGDLTVAALFILTGFLVSFFSKNMIVVLCLALVVSNIFKYGLVNTTEGFKEEIDDSNKSILEKSKDDLKLFNEKGKNSPGSSSSPGGGSSSSPGNTLIKDSLKEPESSPKTKPTTDASLSAAKNAIDKLSDSKIPDDEKSKLEYKNLLELQLKLIDGIENIKPVLTEVVDKIEKIKKRDGQVGNNGG
ncbi:MAG: hypothetical protein EBU93_05435 [Chlamydiae bacterium]|nr:hypothetical protein [Chlamydiota bacterium]